MITLIGLFLSIVAHSNPAIGAAREMAQCLKIMAVFQRASVGFSVPMWLIITIVTTDPGDPMPFSLLHGHQACIWY